MKQLAHIVIAATTLIVMLFGAGGVGLMTCACSGDTSLILPLDEGCCGTDRSCMTVNILQMSDSDVAATLEVPTDQMVAELNELYELHHIPHPLPPTSDLQPLTSSLPPPIGRHSMVMRV